MIDFYQGDIIKLSGFRIPFLIISKNTFIKATGLFHVCPILTGFADGPLHIRIEGNHQTAGVAVCEQIKLIDPQARTCCRIDRIPYNSVMNISDAVQGIFEYD